MKRSDNETMKETKSMKINYTTDTIPSKSGVFQVLYCRAKSTKVVEGTAYFSRLRGVRPKGWTNIINARTGRQVGSTYDRRDARAYHPAVQGWAVAQ